jgi:hypothetical protein
MISQCGHLECLPYKGCQTLCYTFRVASLSQSDCGGSVYYCFHHDIARFLVLFERGHQAFLCKEAKGVSLLDGQLKVWTNVVEQVQQIIWTNIRSLSWPYGWISSSTSEKGPRFPFTCRTDQVQVIDL